MFLSEQFTPRHVNSEILDPGIKLAVTPLHSDALGRLVGPKAPSGFLGDGHILMNLPHRQPLDVQVIQAFETRHSLKLARAEVKKAGNVHALACLLNAIHFLLTARVGKIHTQAVKLPALSSAWLHGAWQSLQPATPPPWG